MAPLKLSVLDLAPVPSGSSGRQALLNTLDLAAWAEGLGYTRYWLAEHHNSAGIASAAPEILISAVAGATRRIRVGSGGIMLPNHASLKVAEDFRLLESLHPGRIDLGLGRAPGTDMLTAQALRRPANRDSFPEQLGELLCFLGDGFPEGHPYRRVAAIPEDAPSPRLWMLSSSGYGAQVAAELGLGLAFAHHIHPDPAVASLRLYRRSFKPSDYFGKPASILTVAAVCAEEQARAETLASSFDLVRLRIEQGSRGGKFPSVEEAGAYPYEAAEQRRILENRNRFFVGTPDRLKKEISALALEAQADEVMVMTLVHDHAARRRSYELLAQAFGTAG